MFSEIVRDPSRPSHEATARQPTSLRMTKRVFFIVGPTATGKSELAGDVAHWAGAEIVSADAFQIYRGFDLLSAKPGSTTVVKVPHHLVGAIPVLQEMDAEKFRQLALRAIAEIHSRRKAALVVGGSGLYIKAVTHGLSSAPSGDPDLRGQLNELSLQGLKEKLVDLDPKAAKEIDLKNRRRLVRAIEICLLSGRRSSGLRTEWRRDIAVNGVFVFRDRDEIYQRINCRVEAMFENGVVEEVRDTGAMSSTAGKMIGLREIRELLNAKISTVQCIAQIQQATRRYAKRQLTWFRRQTNFQPLNLSLLTHNEAVERISQLVKAAGVAQGND
jgi:tRNA dimethylallyltransferase